jgi:hypothetical protein
MTVVQWPQVPPNPFPKPDPDTWKNPMSPDDLLSCYRNTLEWQRQELHRRTYEVNKLKEKIMLYHDELEKLRAGQPQSAYEVLLMFANDPAQDVKLRMRAAEACVQYERPKLSATIQQIHTDSGIAARMEAANKRRLELVHRDVAPDKAIWPVIDAEPA